MTTSPYSLDLRKKVIQYLQLDNSQKSASNLLSPSTINRWWLRNKREGNCAPRKRPGRVPRINLSLVQNYIKTHLNCNSAEMGKHFGMTSGGALYWLKKLGFSYKKKPIPTWKQMKKSEQNI